MCGGRVGPAGRPSRRRRGGAAASGAVRYTLDLHRTLDLTDPDTRSDLGITVDELVADDWMVCKQLGTEAHAVVDQGIRTYSATGVDTILVVFPELLGGSLTEVELVERWDDLADFA